MRPILFHLGEFPVPSFWAMAFLGFFVAFLVVRSDSVRRGLGVEVAYDLTLAAYIGGWVGARLFLIPSGWEYFTNDPIAFLLSGSGWVWYGGLIGGAIGALFVARRHAVPLLVLGDIAAPALAVGLAIGRLGCELSGDGDYGVPTNLPWGMSYPNGVVPTTERVHPAPAYEMFACLGMFAYLWSVRRRAERAGTLFGRYLVMAGIARFFVEFVRRNPAWLVGLTTAQWMSLFAVAIGWLILRWCRSTGEAAPVPETGADDVPVPLS
jgi:phosphatidylglycerol:prolipoprotein diacylglycerol transferase